MEYASADSKRLVAGAFDRAGRASHVGYAFSLLFRRPEFHERRKRGNFGRPEADPTILVSFVHLAFDGDRVIDPRIDLLSISI
jgi:hypothetical protein